MTRTTARNEQANRYIKLSERKNVRHFFVLLMLEEFQEEGIFEPNDCIVEHTARTLSDDEHSNNQRTTYGVYRVKYSREHVR